MVQYYVRKGCAMYKKNIEHLEYRLRRIADNLKVQGRSQLKEHQLTSQQFIAIQWIHEDVKTVGELSKRIDLAISTTSEMVDQLMKKGFVNREKDQLDKRKVILTLTPKSNLVIQEVILKRQEFLKKLMKDYEQNEIEVLVQLINKLYFRLEEAHE